MVVVEKTKREKIVSHQLGVSTGYGGAHHMSARVDHTIGLVVC